MRRCASCYKVAHSGKTHTGKGLAAASMNKTADLGQSAGHDKRESVVAESSTRGNTAYDGDDVLDRSAHLNANDVSGKVDSEFGC